ncbi:uncharacterized protein K441DRAFT_305891 [Cenococcum geophilum 1.58]|uniref:uncharacterized protein n=1 Tax=Cenococcum geophilum 1.58 TaxID=794803 RepID=UPI00358FDE58|nr:hypothetical protein K441DRAFT_305891 [Cenococcum geophilum 1.58]
MAFVNQCSILLALEHCNIDRSFDPTDDCTWANRILVLCTDVLRYCFGDGNTAHLPTVSCSSIPRIGWLTSLLHSLQYSIGNGKDICSQLRGLSKMALEAAQTCYDVKEVDRWGANNMVKME